MFTTLPQMLQSLVADGGRNAFAWREGDRWRHLNYEHFSQQVDALALALRSLGLRRGDKVAIMAVPSPQWLLVDLAVMTAGGVTVPIFSHIAEEIFHHQLDDAEVRWCFAGGDEQWQLIDSVSERWQQIITWRSERQHPRCQRLEELLRAGEDAFSRNAAALPELRAQLTPDDLATIIYTSGSTGMPKGVCLSQRNLCSQLQGAAQRYPLDRETDRALSCLPLAHVFERMVMYFYLSRGINITFGDDIQRLPQLLPEVRPTCMTMVPRLLEKIYAGILKKAGEANVFKRKIAQWAFSEARENDPVDNSDTWSFQIADHLVYQQLRDALGGQMRYLIVGGARLSEDLQRFFINIGLPLYNGYGMSEASPVIAANYPGHNRIGAVGPLFPDVELRFGEADEILVRGPGVMQGYYNQPEKTATVIQDGWLHTGDCGKLEDGFLYITGRIKELFKTSTGKYVAPVPIEQKICESPIVDMAMIIAEGRQFVSCLFFPDRQTLAQLKDDQHCVEQSDAEFLKSPFMCDRMQLLLERVNAELNHWEQIRAYRFIDTDLSIEDETLTPTMKLRRHVIAERYADVIDSLYEEKPE